MSCTPQDLTIYILIHSIDYKIHVIVKNGLNVWFCWTLGEPYLRSLYFFYKNYFQLCLFYKYIEKSLEKIDEVEL